MDERMLLGFIYGLLTAAGIAFVLWIGIPVMLAKRNALKGSGKPSEGRGIKTTTL